MRHAHAHSWLFGACALLAIFLCGCGQERAQQGANVRAGIQAARASLGAGEAAAKVISILDGANAYLPAAVDNGPSDKWPAPAMTPEQIRADPETYSKHAPPEPENGWGRTLAILGVGGSAALFLIGRLAPMLPGAGPLVGGIANMAYAALAPKPNRELDQARDTLHEFAPVIKEAIAALPRPLPDKLTQAIGLLVEKPA